jgi:hypothetical protein
MAGNDSIFYPDPQPVQRTPTVPLPAAAFTPPPKIGGIQAAVFGVILASWPALTDPRPNQFQQVGIAPLTLTYPVAPVQSGPLDDQQIRAIVGWWPAVNEPRPAQFQQVNIAPLTLVYGSKPPVNAPLSAQELVIAVTWPPVWWPQQTSYYSVGWLTAPMPYYGPTPQPNSIIASWQSATPVDLEVGGVLQPLEGTPPLQVSLWALANGNIVRGWWPEVDEPRLQQLWLESEIAPLTLGTVVPPVPSSNIKPDPYTLWLWQPTWGPWPEIVQPSNMSAAIKYGSQPTPLSNVNPSPSLLATWQPPWGPPPDRETGLAHLSTDIIPPQPPGPVLDDGLKGWL